MRYKWLTWLIILAFSQTFAQYQLPTWSVGNAKLTPRNTLILNSTFTSRYAVTGNLQLGANLALMPAAPNAQIKILWWDKDSPLGKKIFFSNWHFKLTSVHTFAFPYAATLFDSLTNFLQLPYNTLPLQLTMHHEIMYSFPLAKKYYKNCGSSLATIKFGWQHTFGADSTLTAPDNGFWFLHTSTFFARDFFFAGLTYDSKLLNNLNLSETFKTYYISNTGIAIENQLFLYFGFGLKKRSTIAAGLSAGYLPRQHKYFAKFAFNFSYKLKLKSKRKKDLNEYLKRF